LESEKVVLGGRVLVLGFGGAGRMMAIEAALSGADVTIAVRSPEKVLPQLPRLSSGYFSVTNVKHISGGFDLLINSTPVGMYPNNDGCPVSEAVVMNCKAVFDAVYNPRETRLTAIADKLGKTAVGGMAMLVWQAAAAHKIWYSAEFLESDIAKIVDEASKKIIS
jgi:shikimate dehydrogenase